MNNKENSTIPITKTILKPEEAAQYLGVSRDWLMEQYRKGKIPGKRISYKVVRFNRDELNEFIRTSEK